jgi:enamine deaminase RidA (YjgF/YER057c/UK114 family)
LNLDLARLPKGPKLGPAYSCAIFLNTTIVQTQSNGRQLISSGSTFEEQIGYSRAVVDGEWIFVSGTTGFDYSSMTIADGIAEQAEQALRNIQSALEQAGASLEDIVRVVYIVPNAAEFQQSWPVLRRYFGAIRPAATMISAGLADPRMRIEIEATARRRQCTGR